MQDMVEMFLDLKKFMYYNFTGGDNMALVKTICKQCNREFETHDYLLKKGKSKFCSRSCSTTYRNIHNNPTKDAKVREKISKNHADVSGKNNPMYGRKGRLAPSYIDGRNSFKGETYRKIGLVHLKKECVICGETELNKLHIHHKDGDKKNNDLSNLTFLCQKCHLTIAHNYKRDDKGKFKGCDLSQEVVL